MMDYKKVTVADKEKYDKAFEDGYPRGCEFSFANVFMWGEQYVCEVEGQISLLSRFGNKSVYSFPLGDGDKSAAIDAIIADSSERGIPCVIGGLSEKAKALLEEKYPERFEYSTNDGSYDYVYNIDDLADLIGRKYGSKRNHVRHFFEAYPEARIVPLTEELFPAVRAMVDDWFSEKATPEDDFRFERLAFGRAIDNYRELEMEGLAIVDDDTVLAVTVASRMTEDTFDVHFEKARSGVDGAYAVINREFARYIREKYPKVRYLDREEDMGIPGLRKAKESYHPHHKVIKYRARLTEN